MKKLIWSNPDGSIRKSNPDVTKKNPNETDDEFYERMIEKWKVIDPTLIGLEVNIVDESDIPTDKTHRNEWTFDKNSKKVKPNPVKVQAKLDAKAAKEARKHAVLAKLKISKDELEDLLK
jgi:hypothetical protein